MATKTTAHRTIIGRVVIVGAAAALLAVGTAGAASAASDTGSTEGNVEVGSELTLTALTDAFSLTGLPGDTVAGLGAVTMNVETNNLAGYGVTVQSATATLVAQADGNNDAIPIGALSVRETGATAFTPVSDTVPTTVHTQATRSAENGDALSNDYSVVIPFVNQDTYTATLNYVAATL